MQTRPYTYLLSTKGGPQYKYSLIKIFAENMENGKLTTTKTLCSVPRSIYQRSRYGLNNGPLWRHMAKKILDVNGPGNDLLPGGTKQYLTWCRLQTIDIHPTTVLKYAGLIINEYFLRCLGFFQESDNYRPITAQHNVAQNTWVTLLLILI